MFHVKRLQTSEAVINSFIDISEVQQVGSEGAKHSRANAASILVWTLLSPRVSDTKCPNMRLRASQNMLAYFMTEYEHVGLWQSQRPNI